MINICDYEINEVFIPERKSLPSGPDALRGNDNFSNSKQYILDQLFIFDYNNEDDKDVLKMKLWVLDGFVRPSEHIYIDDVVIEGKTYHLCEYPDTDVDNPMDHWSTLQNDLIYLDRYIRTKDETLKTNPPEQDFDTLWDNRIKAKEKFLQTVKVECDDGIRYKQDWEQTYTSRPTALSKADFEDLYQAYKTKETAGELENAFDITKKITTYCIDHEINQAEAVVENDKTPAETEADLVVNAEASTDKNDNNYVKQMQEIHDEIKSILESVAPTLPGNTEDEETGETHTYSMYLINVPHRRVYVETVKNDPSHKGNILINPTQSGTVTHSFCGVNYYDSGGYRFRHRNTSFNITTIPCEVFNILSNDLYWELEDNWDDWYYVIIDAMVPGTPPGP